MHSVKTLFPFRLGTGPEIPLFISAKSVSVKIPCLGYGLNRHRAVNWIKLEHPNNDLLAHTPTLFSAFVHARPGLRCPTSCGPASYVCQVAWDCWPITGLWPG